jgi:hypothetical protein
MCCRRGPSSPSSSPARAQKSTRGTQDAGAPDDERGSRVGVHMGGFDAWHSSTMRASERARERESTIRPTVRARERAKWQGCVHVCVPAEGRVSVCTGARVRRTCGTRTRGRGGRARDAQGARVHVVRGGGVCGELEAQRPTARLQGDTNRTAHATSCRAHNLTHSRDRDS